MLAFRTVSDRRLRPGGVCRPRCDWRMRQVHRSRPGGTTGRPFSSSLPFLLQPLLAKLMHCRDLLAQLLALGLFDFDQPHSAAGYRVGRHLAERHRQLR